MPAISPISGAMYVVVSEVHYNWQKDGEWKQSLFPCAYEAEANSMAMHLGRISADTNNVAEYRNVRVAMVQFTEIPDYNDTPPLV